MEATRHDARHHTIKKMKLQAGYVCEKHDHYSIYEEGMTTHMVQVHLVSKAWAKAIVEAAS